LNFFLTQWCIPRISFHDGNLLGIVSEKIRTGVWEVSHDFMVSKAHDSPPFALERASSIASAKL
jgi:hypothetical protein